VAGIKLITDETVDTPQAVTHISQAPMICMVFEPKLILSQAYQEFKSFDLGELPVRFRDHRERTSFFIRQSLPFSNVNTVIRMEYIEGAGQEKEYYYRQSALL
jgi:hypothetical protein